MSVTQQSMYDNAQKICASVDVFLKNGIKLSGGLRSHGANALVMLSECKPMIVYKHNIATFVPSFEKYPHSGNSVEPNETNCEAILLAALAENEVPVQVYLINGVKLSGALQNTEEDCVIISSRNNNMLVYKESIASIEVL